MTSKIHQIAAPLVAASLAGAALAAPSAHAETAIETATVDTLVVTARKREENLQTTPISITAMSGEALAQRQVLTTEGLGQIAPNLIVSQGQGVSGNSSAGAYFIRGIGQIDFLLNTDPGVGVYVDGVYVARSLGSIMDLVDLERVEVLREFAVRLASNVRAIDLPVRFGGEEFVVVMPETQLADAHRIAERIRLHVAGSPFRVMDGEELLTVTISIGVAASVGDDNPAKLIKRADDAMYEAKAHGRNQVVARAA